MDVREGLPFPRRVCSTCARDGASRGGRARPSERQPEIASRGNSSRDRPHLQPASLSGPASAKASRRGNCAGTASLGSFGHVVLPQAEQAESIASIQLQHIQQMAITCEDAVRRIDALYVATRDLLKELHPLNSGPEDAGFHSSRTQRELENLPPLPRRSREETAPAEPVEPAEPAEPELFSEPELFLEPPSVSSPSCMPELPTGRTEAIKKAVVGSQNDQTCVEGKANTEESFTDLVSCLSILSSHTPAPMGTRSVMLPCGQYIDLDIFSSQFSSTAAANRSLRSNIAEKMRSGELYQTILRQLLICQEKLDRVQEIDRSKDTFKEARKSKFEDTFPSATAGYAAGYAGGYSADSVRTPVGNGLRWSHGELRDFVRQSFTELGLLVSPPESLIYEVYASYFDPELHLSSLTPLQSISFLEVLLRATFHTCHTEIKPALSAASTSGASLQRLHSTLESEKHSHLHSSQISTSETHPTSLAQRWVNSYVPLPVDGTVSIAYSTGVVIQFAAFTSLLQNLADEMNEKTGEKDGVHTKDSSSRRTHLLSRISSCQLLKRGLDVFQMFDAGSGYLGWSNNELTNFVSAVFEEEDLTPPSVEQVAPFFEKFAQGNTKLNTSESLCLVDAMFRAILHSGSPAR
ncbi:unnamed protein product [Durusdinium trenchii]|uniref:Uncharacterized protein n=2 Tax=Durusdinium trenchii TaxID=1381693 RepID=A0ABP0HSI3_9DINO